MTAAKRDKLKGKADAPKYTSRRQIDLHVQTNDVDEIGRKYAAYFTSGAFAALRVILATDRTADFQANVDMPGLFATLSEQGEAVNAGSLTQAEAMLMNQATALQTVFARLVERGIGCTEIPAFELNMRMGLRAQAQCRATLETLAAIKNPSSVAFVRQANIAHGPQQVNNGTPAPSRPRENEIPPNKLLEAEYGERLDTGAAGKASGGDPAMAAVGAINGAANAGR